MNISHLRYAVEVEKTGSITRAAENLYMGQPNLSKAIKELENSVGITLFRRTYHGVSPTAKGKVFLDQAREVLSKIQEMAFVNKMDIMGANFYNAVQMMKDRLNANAVPLQLPIGKEDEFKGVIDLMLMKAYIYNDELGENISEVDVPADMAEQAEEYHVAMVEAICETDEELMMRYLDGEEIEVDELKKALRKAVCNVEIIPVFCGTAYRNKGV